MSKVALISIAIGSIALGTHYAIEQNARQSIELRASARNEQNKAAAELGVAAYMNDRVTIELKLTELRLANSLCEIDRNTKDCTRFDELERRFHRDYGIAWYEGLDTKTVMSR